MFSSIPIDDNILKDDIGIKNVKDRDFILLQINKDIKYIIRKSEKNINTSLNEIILDKSVKNIINQNKKENIINEKEIPIIDEEYSNCILF